MCSLLEALDFSRPSGAHGILGGSPQKVIDADKSGEDADH